MTPPKLPVIKRRLKRIAPLQLGKMLALIYGGIGLLLVPIMILVSLFAPTPPTQRMGGAVVGVGLSVLFPVIYAAVGFIGGVIGAAVYNLVAKWVGGIEVEVE